MLTKFIQVLDQSVRNAVHLLHPRPDGVRADPRLVHGIRGSKREGLRLVRTDQSVHPIPNILMWLRGSDDLRVTGEEPA